MERTIDRIALKKEAKQLLDGKVFKMLFCYVIYGIVLAGCFAICFLTPNFLSHYIVGALENVQVISGIVATETLQLIVWGLFLFVRVILFMALIYPFSVCITTVPLAIVEGRTITWKDATAPIKRLRYFIECMITGAAQFLSTLFWTILLIVPGLLVHYRFSFTKYLFLEDNELTFGEMAAKSKNMARDFESQLFSMDLSFLGWLLFGICTGGIGLLYLICYYSVTKVLYFKEIQKFSQPATAENQATFQKEQESSHAEAFTQNQKQEEILTQDSPVQETSPEPTEEPQQEEIINQDTEQQDNPRPQETDATLWLDSSDKGIRIARGNMTNLNTNATQTSNTTEEDAR